MYATISADIVSSTSLSIEETIELKQKIKELFKILEGRYPHFWGRQIKGDYLECLIPNASDAFRIALIIKSAIKSFNIAEKKEGKNFLTYGIRIAIGIGSMRIVDRENGIMDGEAIYLSGRALEDMGVPNKGTLSIETEYKQVGLPLRTVAILTDALINNATKRQCEILYYKLFSTKEVDIATLLNIKQSSVNQHATQAKWYCIEEALNYYEQLNFNAYE